MIIIMRNAILCHHHKENSWRIFNTFTTIYTDDVLWLPTTMSRDVIDMEYHQRKGFTDNRRTEISHGGCTSCDHIVINRIKCKRRLTVYYFTDNLKHSALHLYYIIVHEQISIVLYLEQTKIINFDFQTDTKCIPHKKIWAPKNANEPHLKLNMFNWFFLVLDTNYNIMYNRNSNRNRIGNRHRYE